MKSILKRLLGYAHLHGEDDALSAKVDVTINWEPTPLHIAGERIAKAVQRYISRREFDEEVAFIQRDLGIVLSERQMHWANDRFLQAAEDRMRYVITSINPRKTKVLVNKRSRRVIKMRPQSRITPPADSPAAPDASR
jgi:hypothetical protein